MKIRVREKIFIKDDMYRDNDMLGDDIKAMIATMIK